MKHSPKSPKSSSTARLTRNRQKETLPNPDLDSLLNQFEKLAREAKGTTWAAAKLAYELLKHHGISRGDLAKRAKVSPQRISQYVKAYEAVIAVKKETRKDYSKRVDVAGAYAAWTIYNGFRGEEQERHTLSGIMQKSAEGMSSRQIRSEVTEDARNRRMAEARRVVEATAPRAWQTRCHEGDCLNFLATLKPKSVKVIHLDPPYADYRKVKGKGYVSGRYATSAVQGCCANNFGKEALDLTCDAIRRASPALQDNGAMLLWQAGTRPLRIEIQQSIQSAGLEVAFELALDKCSNDESTEAGQPGRFDEPYSIASEKLVVIKRKDADLVREDHGLPRGDIIKPSFQIKAVEKFEAEFGRPFYSWSMKGKTFSGRSPSRQAFTEYLTGRRKIGEAHEMQKHEETSLFLLMKHCIPGDIVVDLFGCSASFCIAAEQYGCDWHYCEMPVSFDDKGRQEKDSGNFDFGITRLAEYFEWAKRFEEKSE